MAICAKENGNFKSNRTQKSCSCNLVVTLPNELLIWCLDAVEFKVAYTASKKSNKTYLRNSICVVSGKQSKFRNILLPLQEWQHKTIINVGLFLHSPCFAHRLQLSFVSRHFESAILKKQKCETSILKKKLYTISQSILS